MTLIGLKLYKIIKLKTRIYISDVSGTKSIPISLIIK